MEESYEIYYKDIRGIGNMTSQRERGGGVL